MIKDIVFDFGGVLTTIDTGRALARFEALGVENPKDYPVKNVKVILSQLIRLYRYRELL